MVRLKVSTLFAPSFWPVNYAWAVYFLSVVVEQLEESRQRLSRLVQKLEEMRERDLKLNVQLKDNIAQLNQEIADREKRKRSCKRHLNS